jgi:hypothetical protein
MDLRRTSIRNGVYGNRFELMYLWIENPNRTLKRDYPFATQLVFMAFLKYKDPPCLTCDRFEHRFKNIWHLQQGSQSKGQGVHEVTPHVVTLNQVKNYVRGNCLLSEACIKSRQIGRLCADAINPSISYIINLSQRNNPASIR